MNAPWIKTTGSPSPQSSYSSSTPSMTARPTRAVLPSKTVVVKACQTRPGGRGCRPSKRECCRERSSPGASRSVAVRRTACRPALHRDGTDLADRWDGDLVPQVERVRVRRGCLRGTRARHLADHELTRRRRPELRAATCRFDRLTWMPPRSVSVGSVAEGMNVRLGEGECSEMSTDGKPGGDAPQGPA